MSVQIQKFEEVPFHGDVIVAAERGGKVFTSVRGVCRSVGIDYSAQAQKLKAKHWAGVVEFPIPDLQGREQSHMMIDLDSLPYWLATISPNKVHPNCKEKITKYQLEAKQVLADYFLPKATATEIVPATMPDYDPDDHDSVVLVKLLKARTEIRQLQKQQEAQWQAIKATELVALEADATATKALEAADVAGLKALAAHKAITNASGWYTTMGYANILKLKVPIHHQAQIGKMATKRCENLGIDVQKVHDPRFGRVGSYPEDVLAGLKDEFVKRSSTPA